ncbi:MAG: DUF5004 domain-containing protein [Bacteroidota bacterium]
MKKVCFLLLFVVVMIACSKDDDAKVNVSAVLTSKTNGWVFTSILVGSADLFQYYEDCDKDDATIFASAGTYTVSNTVKCDDSESAISDSGTWSLSSDQKTLTITDDAGPETLTILEVDDSHLKATLSGDIDGTAVTATVTLVPKK